MRPSKLEEFEMGVAGDTKLDKKVHNSPKASGNGTGQAEWRGYINVNLDASQKAQFDDWMRTDDPWDVMAAVVASGAYIAVKLNQDGGGFLASVTQRNPGHINAGLAVTARAGEAGKAMFRALFLVAVLGVDADWAAGKPPADPDRW